MASTTLYLFLALLLCILLVILHLTLLFQTSRQASQTVSDHVLLSTNAKQKRAAPPPLQWAYMVIVSGCWFIMFVHGYPLVSIDNTEKEYNNHDHHQKLSSWHKQAGYLVFLLCILTFLTASLSSPGTVTATTLQKYNHYPYDYLLYIPRTCPTLKILKVARSTYMPMTRTHVPRADHYCPWIGNAVGEENYRFFLLFVITQWIMCGYGTWATYFMLYFETRRLQRNWMHVCLVQHLPLAGIGCIMGIATVCLTGLLGFHGYLTGNNVTTNEYFKWRKIKAQHRKLKQRYERAKREGKSVGPKREDCAMVQANRDLVASASLSSSAPSFHGGGVNGSFASSAAATGPPLVTPAWDSTREDSVTCTGPSAFSNTTSTEIPSPITFNDAYRRHAGNHSQTNTSTTDSSMIEDPGPLPPHLYNLGFLENIKEVLFPRSLRVEEQDRQWRKNKNN